MIPKKIHYCWFGKNPLPEEAKNCIESWKKFCPDYEIIEWNEDNYDVTKNQYMKDAYDNKMWAFVSDYARIDIIYNHGGIYFDTDVEIIKNFDGFLNDEFFAGWENRDEENKQIMENSVALGLGFGAEKGNEILKEILDYYEGLSFYNDDGSLNLVACPKYQTEVLKKFGLNDNERSLQKFHGCVIYPEEYFSPKSIVTGKITLTSNTYAIHHFSMSWLPKKEQEFAKKEWELMQKYGYKKAKGIMWWKTFPYRIKRKIKSLFLKNR